MEDLIRAIEELGQYTCWDYILFVANIISVIISACALFAAIAIPKKIAKSQNDIALFEKRYQLYKSLRPLINFGNDLLRIKDEDLKKLDEKMRALNYLKVYVMAKDRDYDEIVDIGLIINPIYDDNKNLLGCDVSHYLNKDMNSYTLNLRQHIYSHQSNIELTSFLFSKDIEELLQRLADSYCNFMNSVCSHSGLDINNKLCRDELINEIDFQTSHMEKKKREFLNVIKEISDKNILKKVEEYLRIKG